MKFNWGFGIAVAFTCFVAMMIFLVSLCLKQEFHLVADDYYEQEIRYQSRIEQINNTKKLQSPLDIKLDGVKSTVSIIYPVDHTDIQGKINFYRPSNARLDFEVPVKPSENTQQIDVKDLTKGKWLVKVNWSDNNVSYFFEKIIFIQ